MTDRRRALPSVDRLLRAPAIAAAFAGTSRAILTHAIRAALAAVRDNGHPLPDSDDAWKPLVEAELAQSGTPTLRRVVNATGVVLHTNFGRAPLARAALDAIGDAAARYSTLEYDAAKGARGSRHVHCAGLLTELTGARDALVVNNAASALMLVLAVAADDGITVVSRGELIEIGGGFRIPEIMDRSGTTLVEVGTTNRTRLADYEKALGRPGGQAVRRSAKANAAILKVHRSNFRIEGFTEEASLAELVSLGKKKRVPVLYDLGGGLMHDLPGLGGEPTLRSAVRGGATAVVASGDKLLGGPQAGIILGTAKFLAACRSHPFARAVRADKLTLAALSATLLLYRDPAQATDAIPVLRMLTLPPGRLEARAEALMASLPSAARASVARTRATVGGGAFPGVELESSAVAVEPGTMRPAALAYALRRRSVPIVGIVQRDRLLLDVRTLLDGDDALIARALTDVLA